MKRLAIIMLILSLTTIALSLMWFGWKLLLILFIWTWIHEWKAHTMDYSINDDFSEFGFKIEEG